MDRLKHCLPLDRDAFGDFAPFMIWALTACKSTVFPDPLLQSPDRRHCHLLLRLPDGGGRDIVRSGSESLLVAEQEVWRCGFGVKLVGDRCALLDRATYHEGGR